jgi:hypothetical protein
MDTGTLVGAFVAIAIGASFAVWSGLNLMKNKKK